MVNFEQPRSLCGPNQPRMDNDISDYERLCDEELAAADRAEGKDARIEHLEQAYRFAKEASTERAARMGSAHLSA